MRVVAELNKEQYTIVHLNWCIGGSNARQEERMAVCALVFHLCTKRRDPEYNMRITIAACIPFIIAACGDVIIFDPCPYFMRCEFYGVKFVQFLLVYGILFFAIGIFILWVYYCDSPAALKKENATPHN